jgi:hypothetical protein
MTPKRRAFTASKKERPAPPPVAGGAATTGTVGPGGAVPPPTSEGPDEAQVVLTPPAPRTCYAPGCAQPSIIRDPKQRQRCREHQLWA